MKKLSVRGNPETRARVLRMADGLVSVAVLMSIFLAVSLISTSAVISPLVDYFLAYILLAVSYLLQAITYYKVNRLLYIKYLCYAGVLALAGVLLLILDMCFTSFVILFEAFLLVILANRILAAITAAKIRNRILNILVSLFFLYYVISTLFISPDNFEDFVLAHSLMISGKALGHIIAISFSQMRFKVLRKILRKTFAAEILFGLALLIISFSFIFQALEPNIVTYFDALWYCFAVVTTIGFGDFTVLSPFSRVLSVVLGIYGIIVVALITSIIVNFYNEVKNDPSYDDRDEPDQVNTAKAEEPAESASAVKGSGTQE